MQWTMEEVDKWNAFHDMKRDYETVYTARSIKNSKKGGGK